MDRVGGFASYCLLLQDSRAMSDVMIVMEAEAEAARIQRMRAEQKSARWR